MNILTCPNCDARVVPTRAGECPSCRRTIAEPSDEPESAPRRQAFRPVATIVPRPVAANPYEPPARAGEVETSGRGLLPNWLQEAGKSAKPPEHHGLRWLLLSPHGRAPRGMVWSTLIVGMFALVPIVVLSRQMTPSRTAGPWMASVYDQGIPLLLALSMLLVKRLHDRNKSGWWLLLALVPVVGWLWALVELGFLRGTVGDNAYGYDRTHC